MPNNILPILSAEDLFAALSKQRIEYNIKIIDARFYELADTLGRPLTENEQADILDIVDEYTPKGDDGMYLYPPIPFDYAWQIYEIKNSVGEH